RRTIYAMYGIDISTNLITQNWHAGNFMWGKHRMMYMDAVSFRNRNAIIISIQYAEWYRLRH
ncbi:MAG: hypothetical protein ACKOAK_01620, partial [Ignavibacteria bacterium]